MAKLLRLTTRRAIDEQAAAWITRIDAGLTPERRADLERWLQSDPRHAEALTRLAARWDDMDMLHELSAMFPLPAASTSGRGVGLSRWAGVAAVAVSVVAVVAAVRMFSPQDASPIARAVPVPPGISQPQAGASAEAAIVLTTRVGGQRTERLPDGSIVQLNTDSELHVAFTASERVITLRRGESQFDVVHDTSRPFVVRVGERRIRAVGTAFNVRVTGDRVEVLVTEGRVAIADSERRGAARLGRTVEVAAGELAELDQGQASVTQAEPAATNAKLAWQRGMIVFNGEPLASALREVERYTSVRFELEDPALGTLLIGGYYKIGDVDGLERSLEEYFPLTVTREGDRAIIRAAGVR